MSQLRTLGHGEYKNLLKVTGPGREPAVRAASSDLPVPGSGMRAAHLLRRNIEGDGSHVHLDEAVSARQDEKQTCNTQDQRHRLGSTHRPSGL